MMREHSDADRERQRELAVYRYVRAFEQEEFDVVAEVLRLAEADPELDRQLVSVNAALHAEAGLQPINQQARVVRKLLLRYMPTAIAESEEEAPLTVGDVAARVQSDPTLSRTLNPADRLIGQSLVGSAVPMPPQPTSATIAKLARDLGVEASERYWELFRRAAVLLGISRQRGQIQLAAARRATGRHTSGPKPTDRRDQGTAQ